jgi:hypothetical protein
MAAPKSSECRIADNHPGFAAEKFSMAVSGFGLFSHQAGR